MEAVRTFNNELSSLYEARPPVSRAKMTHITKCAIKAIKFYKHVVQSVEKFILKCKPEYKVPGLYVIDSIVRQSRHQFSQEKDVYAPRFTKNIVITFQNLLKCPSDEKSKIVRVLNLWQKNAVFPIEVIQPLMDLAADHTNMDLVAAAQRAVDRVVPAAAKSSQQKSATGTPAKSGDGPKGKGEPVINNQASADIILTTQTDMLNTVNQLLQQSQQPQSLDEQQQQLQQLQVLQQQLLEQTQMMQQPEDQGPVIDNTLLAQIQTLTNQLLNRTGDMKPPEPAFNKNLLDFDYGESDEDEDRKEDRGANSNTAGPVRRLLTDPALMEHIQQMSQSIQKDVQLQNELSIQEQLRKRLLQQQQEEFDQQINQSSGMQRGRMSGHQMMPQFGNVEPPPNDRSQNMETDDVVIIQDDYHRDRSHRGRDRSRSPKRRRKSRSRSRERRKRSRSRDRHRRSRSGDREKAREKERERWKKRLPPIKEKHVSVCSTTLFIGHLAKLTSEEELVRELENYGAVDSINMIPPRGCAFVCLNRRKDAAKAVEKMKGMKINGSAIKIAWAPGKGLKDLGFKDEWFVDLGVTYIPWDKLPKDLSLLIDGGMLDEDTLPDHLKELAAAAQQTENTSEEKQPSSLMEPHPAQINLPPGGPPVMPPGQPSFPPPMPGMPGNSIGVLQPGPPVGMLNPMLIPMPGQTLASLPGQVGMHPIMTLSQQRMPQVNTSMPIPLMSIPNQPSTTSAGSQLNAAIQNIMSSSGGPSAVKQVGPHLVRPGFNNPNPGVFHAAFNPPHGYNPNVPPPRVPPPNFRLPPPAFSGGAPLGDGDSTPEQDEGQATVTKVISNDWPSKLPGRDGDNRFSNANSFGQPPAENRMPLQHDPKLLQNAAMGNRLPQPRGGAPPLFNQHNSNMNPNSPRPLLGPRLMQPERADMNGPHARFLSGPLGLRPFGPGSVGSPLRPQGLVEMGGPQPLMSNRFGSPRNPGQSLLGPRPGFPGARMMVPHQRFQLHQQGGPRPGFGPPMDDRMRPPFDSPNRPFDRPEFDRFGDRDRMRFPPPHGNGPDDRGLISDRWGPIDGPPGVERDLDHGRDRGPFDRFERNEFRRENDGNPDWRANRRDSRNNRMDEENDMGQPPDVGSRRNRHGDRENPDKKMDRATRDKDGRRKSRWSNLDPSLGENESVHRENINDHSKMDTSVNMEDTVNLDTSVNMEESVDMDESIETSGSENVKDNSISDAQVDAVAKNTTAPPVVDTTQLDLNAQSDSSCVDPKAVDESKCQENGSDPEPMSDSVHTKASSPVPPETPQEAPQEAQPTQDLDATPVDDMPKAEGDFVPQEKPSEVLMTSKDSSCREPSKIINFDAVNTSGFAHTETEPEKPAQPTQTVEPVPEQNESPIPEAGSAPAENGSQPDKPVVGSNCQETESAKGNGTVEKSPIEEGELEPGEASS